MNPRNNLMWATAALLAGIMLALLPLHYAVVALAIGIIGIGALIDVRITLVVTLFAAPFKALLETEIPALKSLPLDIGQSLLLMTLVVWLIHTVIHHAKLFRWTPLYIPLLIFIMLALPSFWNTISLELSIKELTKWVEMLIIIALVLSLSKKSSTWLIIAVIMAGCVQAVMGISQFLSETGPESFRILDHHFRAYGSFGNPDPFAGFMSLCLCVAIGMFIYQVERVYQQYKREGVEAAAILCLIAALAAVAVPGLGLVFSWSRGAWVGFGVALVVMLVCFPRRRRVSVAVLVTLVMLIGLTLTLHLIPSSVVARLSDFTVQFTGYDVRGVVITDSNYALIERLAHWQAALAMAADHVWFGLGLGGYPVAYPQYALMNWPLALGHAHNYYLNVLAETGIVGMLGYVVAVAGAGWLIGETFLGAGQNRALVIGILGAWIGLSIHNAFDMLYVNNMTIHIGVVLGLVAGYKNSFERL